ncbi:hypothetical protein O7608_15820 [Solwaraspora sp. WMMA2056]|uniref:hypothetical protein n=1 Tax=Solwaraspora sp. WMMA2056 TaxID=3015161 RepID=UPI00259B01DC|nr:hypothetical protein [Solwaraspora sp. WMMA2056]WJK43743.1 hypothetical protein O7608_15820 [Solwaraspora sp. WMMA2056]
MTSQRIAGLGIAVMAGALTACTTTEPTSDGATGPGPMSAAPAPASGVAATSAAPTPQPTATGLPEVLSGTRQVTIVRVGSFESGLSMTDDGRLAEVDGDEGRQVFVPIPMQGRLFLIESYRGVGDGPGIGEPVCWRVRNPGDGQPLSVEGAECDAGDPRQRFEIVAADTDTDDTFMISNSSAYLRTSARSGLILEEQGDGSPAPDGFRFNDNGPAPTR